MSYTKKLHPDVLQYIKPVFDKLVSSEYAIVEKYLRERREPHEHQLFMRWYDRSKIHMMDFAFPNKDGGGYFDTVTETIHINALHFQVWDLVLRHELLHVVDRNHGNMFLNACKSIGAPRSLDEAYSMKNISISKMTYTMMGNFPYIDMPIPKWLMLKAYVL